MTDVFYEITENYSAQQMFDLVNDIEAYPQFVPDCTNTGLLKKQDNVVFAFIEVEKLGFKKRFSTRNQSDAPTSITVNLVDGPFKQLTGQWSFIAINDNCCKIRFELSFEFNNRLFDLTFTPIFKDVMANMVRAFSKRAKQIYG